VAGSVQLRGALGGTKQPGPAYLYLIGESSNKTIFTAVKKQAMLDKAIDIVKSFFNVVEMNSPST
jgi:hypothetical protein